MKKRSPLLVSLEIFGDMSGEKNVPGIAAEHHALGDVKAGTSEIGMTVDIDNTADRAAVHSHSKFYHRMSLESATDFESAVYWLLRALIKYQRHAVAGG